MVCINMMHSQQSQESQEGQESRIIFDAVSLSRDGVEVLSDISLALQAGTITALLGPNGAGKTSLLHCASSVMACSRGRVLLNGADIQSFTPPSLAQKVAVLPQQSGLNFPFVVEDVVAMGRYPHSDGQLCDRAIVHHLMDLLHIRDLAQRPYTALSGGEKQRTQLARVLSQLICSPQLDVYDNSVLLLDEPIAALDMPHQTLLMNLLQQLAAKGLTIFIALHDVNLAATYADKIALLKAGHLIAFDSVSEVITEAMIKQVYDIEVDIIAHPKTAKPLVIPEV